MLYLLVCNFIFSDNIYDNIQFGKINISAQPHMLLRKITQQSITSGGSALIIVWNGGSDSTISSSGITVNTGTGVITINENGIYLITYDVSIAWSTSGGLMQSYV